LPTRRLLYSSGSSLPQSSSPSAVSSQHQPVWIVSTLARCATAAAKQSMCRSLAHGAAHWHTEPLTLTLPLLNVSSAPQFLHAPDFKSIALNISRVQPPPATAPPTAHAQPATPLPAARVEPTSMMPPAAAPSAPATPKRNAQCHPLQSTLHTLRTFVF
jgi:hypothetical protein